MARHNSKWKIWKIYLSTNKEMLDAELYAIGKALGTALRGGETGRRSSKQHTDSRWTRIHI